MAVTTWMHNEWKRLTPYFSLLDFGAKPSSRVGWIVRVTVIAFAAVVVWQRLNAMAAPLVKAKPPIPIPSEETEDYRFRLPERTRREIFEQISENEQALREHALQTNSWNGHLWSREDDRGHFERLFFRKLAKQHNISLSQVYLSDRRCHALAPTRPRCGLQAWQRAGIAVPRSRRRSSVRSAGIIPASLMGHEAKCGAASTCLPLGDNRGRTVSAELRREDHARRRLLRSNAQGLRLPRQLLGRGDVRRERRAHP